MTEEKKVELSKQQQIENWVFKVGFSGAIVVACGWTVIMWVKAWQRWNKRNPGRLFIPKLPRIVTVWIVGESYGSIFHTLKAYHVNYFTFMHEWAIEHNMIGMRLTLLVNPSLYDQVDSILFNQADGRWIVESAVGELRDYNFQPHRQQRQVQSTHKPKSAKLGKTYK